MLYINLAYRKVLEIEVCFHRSELNSYICHSSLPQTILMSSRALRKLQRQRQTELLEEALDSESDEDDEFSSTSGKKVVNVFEILEKENNAINSEAEKSVSEEEQDEPLVEGESPIVSTNKKAKNKKKKKKQQKKKKVTGKRDLDNQSSDNEKLEGLESSKNIDDDIDEIEKAAAELKLKYRERDQVEHVAGVEESATIPLDKELDEKLNKLLGVNISMLNPDLEIRKIFGRIVEKRSVNARHDNLRRKRHVLVQPQEGWPPLVRSGLGMKLTGQSQDLECFFEITQSRAYQEVQETFEYYVQTYDPNNLLMLLRSHPFHIDTLLQVSEIIDQQGDHELSAELVARGLYAFDSILHPRFNLATGATRLPFAIPSNRRLFLCIWRYLQSLQSRGCWRTVFEFCKALLQFDMSDPYAIGTCIDIYALRRREFAWIIDFANYLENSNKISDTPNMLYSSALAMFYVHGDTADTRASMLAAFERAPYMLSELLDTLNISFTKSSIPSPQDPVQELHSAMYALYAKDSWSDPTVLAFINSILEKETVTLHDVEGQFAELTENLSRRVILLNEQSLRKFLPQRILQGTILSFDPLPPDTYLSESQVFGRDISRRIASFLSDYLSRAREVNENEEEPPAHEFDLPPAEQLLQQIESEVGEESEDGTPVMTRLRSFFGSLFTSTNSETEPAEESTEEMGQGD